MANYASKHQRTASASASVGYVAAPASSMRRIRLYHAIIGSEGAPADVANLWQFQRISAIGTATSVTPALLDLADAACVAVAGENSTVEPTYTAGLVLLDWALNQKATDKWYAPLGGELVIPATANAGIGIRTPTAGSSVAITATCHFSE